MATLMNTHSKITRVEEFEGYQYIQRYNWWKLE